MDFYNYKNPGNKKVIGNIHIKKKNSIENRF